MEHGQLTIQLNHKALLADDTPQPRNTAKKRYNLVTKHDYQMIQLDHRG